MTTPLRNRGATLSALRRHRCSQLIFAAALWGVAPPAWQAEGEVLYAVPGWPLVAERTVELLRDDPRFEVEVVPTLSFLDLAWDRLGIDLEAAKWRRHGLRRRIASCCSGLGA